jgi:hypothetical protein
MTIQKTRKNESTIMTVAQREVCSHCQHGHVANPWLKPEIVLLCAVGTFGISAIIWAVTTPHDKPVAKQQVVARPATTLAPSPVSEMDRLFSQAGSMPVVPVRTRVSASVPAKQAIVTPAPVEVVKPKKEPVVAKPVTVEETPTKESPKEVVKEPVVEEKPVEPKHDTAADVAEYNRLLLQHMEKAKSAAPDTVDGASQSTPVEPPTFEEWLKSGKQTF